MACRLLRRDSGVGWVRVRAFKVAAVRNNGISCAVGMGNGTQLAGASLILKMERIRDFKGNDSMFLKAAEK